MYLHPGKFFRNQILLDCLGRWRNQSCQIFFQSVLSDVSGKESNFAIFSVNHGWPLQLLYYRTTVIIFNLIPEQFTAIGPPSFIWRGGGEGQKKLWWDTFQRLRPEEFSSGDYAGDFGLRSFFWPEIYCEGPLYEYEYEYGYEYWFTDS